MTVSAWANLYTGIYTLDNRGCRENTTLFFNISCILLDFIMKVTILTPHNVTFDMIHENHEREKNEKG